MLAKSDSKLDFNVHSEIVWNLSNVFLRKVVNSGVYDECVDVVRISSLLHDIGKLTVDFQNFLLNRSSSESNSLKFYHNEVGWAFLSKYLIKSYKDRDLILNIVYWHHGINNKLNSYTDSEILHTIDSESLGNMLTYLRSVVGDENICLDIENCDSVLSPLFYIEGSDISKLLLCRSVVITCDRLGSNINNDNNVLNNYFGYKVFDGLGVTLFDGSDRFERQKEIVNQVIKHNTSVIKAPAGFGKTVLGLLWALKGGKKCVWVLPTNVISTSLYRGVLKELKNLNIERSVELVLRGEVIESNNDNLFKLYSSDIIITNIDNFLAPHFKNGVMDNSGLMMGSNVIFDEYHGLVTEAPLMSLFVEIMRVRHRMTNSNTLLLSATPVNCWYLWDTLENKTRVLPNDLTHYEAVHGYGYKIMVHDKMVNVVEDKSVLVIENTVRNAQKRFNRKNYTMLFHSKYTEDDKRDRLDKLLTFWGKDGNINERIGNVIGTHILQESLDISFNSLYEKVLSSESTLQRIGRVNRWGEFDGVCDINIVRENIIDDGNKSIVKSDNTIKDLLYDRKLSDKWFDHISKYDKHILTLDCLYEIYNDFCITNMNEIKRLVKGRYDVSRKHLKNIYPIKIINRSKKNKDVLTAGSNKLRSTNYEVFYIIRDIDNNWVGPFSEQIIGGDLGRYFNEDNSVRSKMVKNMKILIKNGDMRFNYSNMLKKYKNKDLTLDIIRKESIKSDTPYMVFDRYYDKELGIVKNS